MKIGKKVQQFRVDKGYDIAGFSGEMMCSISLQRQIECGARKPSRKYMSRFLILFPNADIKYIFF